MLALALGNPLCQMLFEFQGLSKFIFQVSQYGVNFCNFSIYSFQKKKCFSGQQVVEEHLVIIGCTNNVPALSLLSNSSDKADS